MENSTITQQHRIKSIFAGVVGNVLEWYDFAVYGFFAPIFAKLFFPSEDPTVSLIAAFGAFAAGFLMRPIGALFFGHIGDKIGRKRALNLSVMLMAIPTFCIGLMPTHAQIGISAAIILVLLRMLQGLSVGGEYTSSIVYLAECAPKEKRGLYCSATLVGASGGILLGSLIGSIISNNLTEAQLYAWGWRIPFLFGVLVAIVGYIIRRNMPETLTEDSKSENPIKEMRQNWREILTVGALNILSAVTFYAVFVFMVTWLVDFVHESRGLALRLNSMSMFVLLIGVAVSGWASDYFGRKPILVGASLGMVLFSYPLIWLMHHENASLILVGQVGIAIILAAYIGPIPAAIAEMFPKKIRVSAVSFGYNLTYAIFGGTTPIVAIWLIQKEHNDLAFVWYIIGAALISFVVALKLKESAFKPLQ